MESLTNETPYVLLRWKRNVVGTAKVFFKPNESTPSTSLHGHKLSLLAEPGQNLVTVYHVTIFREFLTVRYPYCYQDSTCGTPNYLGDLNKLCSHFKSMIAWDHNQLIHYKDGTDLGDIPREIAPSMRELRSVFDQFSGKPFRRVRFGASGIRALPTSLQNAEKPRNLDGTRHGILRTSSRAPDGLSNASAERHEESLCTGSRYLKSSYEESQDRFAFSSSEDSADEGKQLLVSNCQNVDVLPGTELSRGLNHITGEEDRVDRPRVLSCRSSADRQQIPGRRRGRYEEEIAGSDSAEFTQDCDSETERPISMSYDRNTDCQEIERPAKRRYVFKHRQRAEAKLSSDLFKKRQDFSRRLDNPFHQRRECCLAECLNKVDPLYAFVKYKEIMAMGREERKRALIQMIDRKGNSFRFDGMKVCSRFLSTAFHFSTCLQSCVKNTPRASASSTAAAVPRDVSRDTKRDLIVNFLRQLAQACGDQMPTRSHTVLPSMRKKDVYEKFSSSFYKTSHAMDSVPSKTYFYRVWKQECQNIKTHRHHGFTVCTKCESLRAQMNENLLNESVLLQLKQELSEHHRVMTEERRSYTVRRNKAILYPTKYCSIVIDGADQKSYGLPHFIFDTKSDDGHKIKIKCVGVLEHLQEKKLSLFSMTSEYPSGANHVIECAHRVLNEKKDVRGRLPEVLYVQVDNCTRENKNRYFMAYFELLVSQGVFLEVQISFLPIGHTHTDIDQSFSAVANRLRMVDAITMEDLLSELRKCYTPRAHASELLLVANFSGLCEATGCLRKVENFSQFRYFRFTRTERKWADSLYFAQCHVKIQDSDAWKELSGRGNYHGFLKFIPDFSETPHTKTIPPDNIIDVNRCLRAAEGRIRNTKAQEELERLRDRVYEKRIEPFHWDLSHTFELNGDYRDGEPQSICLNENSNNEVESSSAALRYNIGSFVAVKPDGEVSCDFWIAQVLETYGGTELNDGSELKIRWYNITRGAKDEYRSRYIQSKVREDSKLVPFDDVISTDSILVQFQRLTSKSTLHEATQKAIRSVLNKN